jgi:hypothetical protein
VSPRAQPSPGAHPGERRHSFDVRQVRSRNRVGLTGRLLNLGSPSLIDEELYEGARIEVEDQRRPSTT